MSPNFLKSKAPSALFSIGAFACVCFFAFHALQGEYGLFALMRADSRVAELEMELADLRTQRSAAENRARRLGDDYLDVDLLDERARIGRESARCSGRAAARRRSLTQESCSGRGLDVEVEVEERGARRNSC